jgi:hypothetical protein
MEVAMRKAASQRTQVLVSTIVLLFVFLFSVTLSYAYSVDPNKPVSGDQDTGDMIAGNIRIEGTEAIGTVMNTGGDTVKIGLASYTKVDENLENQSLYASSEMTIGPGETKDIRVGIPCWSQVDLFRIFPERPGQDGGVITSFKNNVRYGQRLISAVHTMNECGGGSNPTATPTASPSATPVVTVSPAPSAAPTNPPSGGSTVTSPPSDGRSDGRRESLDCVPESQNGRKDCSGNVVPTGGIVAGVSTQQLPSTGSQGLMNVLLLGVALFNIGFVLRRVANDLEQ